MVDIGIPLPIEIVFWSGDKATVIETDVVKRGIVYKRLWMILDELTRHRKKIDERSIEDGGQLDYNISEHGVIVREYYEGYLFFKTDNPQNPMIIALCNFDGTIKLESELHMVAERQKRAEELANELTKENNNLMKRIGHLSEQIKELKTRGVE